MTDAFLSTPTHVHNALVQLAQEADRVDLAMAFVGTGAAALVKSLGVPVRLLCWASPGATDPDELLAIEEEGEHEVRHRHGMHAKVVVAWRDGRPVACLVGSANLSSSGLGFSDRFGRDEAAVLSSGERTLRQAASWFDSVWRAPGTDHLGSLDLDGLRRAWRKVRRTARDGREPAIRELDLSEDSARKLRRILEFVTTHELVPMVQESREVEVLSTLDPPHLTDEQRELITDQLQAWYPQWLQKNRFTGASLAHVRQALSRLYDEEVDVIERLRQAKKGAASLDGLGIPMLTTLLYWRRPENYPPLNGRTEAFLQAIGWGEQFPGQRLPSHYAHWLEVAAKLAQRFDLPTLGHVDRVVWYWSEGLRE